MKRNLINGMTELIFWIAIAVSFLKTADLFQFFAPRQAGGYSTEWYGLVAALCVEGMFIVAKYSLQWSENEDARQWSGAIALITFGMSFIAQGLDGVMVRDAIGELHPMVRDFMMWLVPGIPLLVAGSIVILGALDKERKSQTQPKQDKPKGKTQTLLDAMYDNAMARLRGDTSKPRMVKPIVSPPEQTQHQTTSPKAQPPTPKE